MPLKEQRAKYHAQFFGVKKNGEHRVKLMVIPPAVLAEQSRRASLIPRSLTAFLLGDPLPGCSAGERIRVHAPSIVHDHLDDLIFGRV